ncbi:heterokaryon incompatibility protein-domain-containing protein [Phyllosticta capitalensis]
MAIDVDPYDNLEDRCGICLDLQPRFFQPLDPSHRRIVSTEEDKESRLHCVTFHGIEKSAADGCPLCSILKQGIDQLWPLQTDRTFQPPPAEPLSDREAFIKSWSDEEESTGLWSDEEDSTNTQEWDLCIEIRPGRSLLVSRVDRKCVRSIVKGKYCQSKLCVDRPWRTPIEFFSLNTIDSVHESFGPSGTVPTIPDDHHIRNTLEKWLEDCDSNHKFCSKDIAVHGEFCPKRLIQVIRGAVCLVELPPDSKVAYMTLSHCWGSKPDKILRTLKENLASRQKGIDWAEIPPTFQDAIKITRLLECDYIWIDSLCIIQDDKNDWEDQAAQMARIYSNSYLNIAATASKDPFGGLLSARTWSTNLPFEVESRPLESVLLGHNVVARPHLHQIHQVFRNARRSRDAALLASLKTNKFPLLQRAWVFQERILSRRTLHFTGSEIVWECLHRTLCECGDCDVPVGFGNFKTFFGNNIGKVNPREWSTWEVCVREYTSLDITRPTDWSQAIIGLAAKFAQQLKSNYVAGLWENNFAYSLLWMASRHIYDTSPLREYKNSQEWPFHLNLSLPKGPPTWSWLSYRAAATTSDRSFSSMVYDCFGVETRFHFNFGDSVTQARERHAPEFRIDPNGRPVFLEGASRKGYICTSPEHKTPEVGVENAADLNCLAENIFLDFQPPDSRDVRFTIFCLLVVDSQRSHDFLILAAPPGKSFYIRIGVGSARYSNKHLFDDAEVRRFEVR